MAGGLGGAVTNVGHQVHPLELPSHPVVDTLQQNNISQIRHVLDPGQDITESQTNLRNYRSCLCHFGPSVTTIQNHQDHQKSDNKLLETCQRKEERDFPDSEYSLPYNDIAHYTTVNTLLLLHFHRIYKKNCS